MMKRSNYRLDQKGRKRSLSMEAHTYREGRRKITVW
jgi:hypothetical protein